MTNYTINILKKEEVRILDCMDVLNAIGAGNDSAEREGLNSFLDNIRESIKTLENSRGIVTGDSSGLFFKGHKIEVKHDLNKYKWDTKEDNNEIGKILDAQWSSLKVDFQKQVKDESESRVFNIAINLDSVGSEARSAAKIADEIVKKLREVKFN